MLHLKKRPGHPEKVNRLTARNVGMSIGGLSGGIILTVLGALMLAEGIITLLGNPSFIFTDNMNRGFELVVGLVTLVVAGTTMDLSKVGTLGKLLGLFVVEPEILEVKGDSGVLRLNVRKSEIARAIDEQSEKQER